MRNPHLHFGLHNTSVEKIQKEIFDHIKVVRNVTIEVREDNVRTLQNPSNSFKPAVSGKRFLLRLRMRGSYIKCDCDIG